MDYSNLVSVVNSLSKLVEEQKEKIEQLQDEYDRATKMVKASDIDYCEINEELVKTKLALETVSNKLAIACNNNLDKNNTVLIDIAAKLLLARGRDNCRFWYEGSPSLSDDISFVGAIKAVRAATGWGLKDAKNFVEAFQWLRFTAKKEEHSDPNPCIDTSCLNR